MVSAANVRRNKQKTVCEDSTWGVCLMVSAASVGRNKQKFVRTVHGACVYLLVSGTPVVVICRWTHTLLLCICQ